MTLIRLNAAWGMPLSPSQTAQPSDLLRVRDILRSAPHLRAPVIVMIHGYKYDPARSQNCPHGLLFAQKHRHSWPTGLGITQASETLGISFGWRARGRLRDVFAAAAHVGRELAMLIALLQAEAPQRPVHLLAHSLGAEVALNALRHAPAHSIGRVILLAGACYRAHAEAALASTAGRTAELINIRSRQNRVFDLLFERLVPADVPGDRTVGHGIVSANAVDIDISCAASRRALGGMHLFVSPPKGLICHWSGYTTPGALSAYAQLMEMPGVLSLRRLRQALPDRRGPPAVPLGKALRSWLSRPRQTEPLPYEPAN